MIEKPTNPFFNPTATPVAPVTYPAHEENGYNLEMQPGLTSIIVPVFLNSYPAFHYTGHCLGSIKQNTNREKTPYELLFVQNGSRAMEPTVVEEFTNERFDLIGADKIITNPKNLGFGAAVNQAIRCSVGEYIAIVNNDAMVFDHWLEDLQDALQAGLDLVMATPMYGLPFARAVEAANFRANDVAAHPEIQESFSDFKDFSCVLTTRQLFEKIGLFDEQFFMYGEDLDLMRRIAKAEGRVASTTRVRTFHISGGTSSGVAETPEILNVSKAKLAAKWGADA